MKKAVAGFLSVFILCLLGCHVSAKMPDNYPVSHHNGQLYFNEKVQCFELPIVLIDNHTYIPLRETAEKFGMNVEWQETSNSIRITDSNGLLDKRYGFDMPDTILTPFCENNSWGYKDADENVIIAPKYEQAYDFCESRALVCCNGLYGYIDINGNEIIPCQYENAYSFHDGAALVYLGKCNDTDQWGYIDPQGGPLFSEVFALAKNFQDGYAAVLKPENDIFAPEERNLAPQWSFIDKKGHYVTAMNFDEVQDLRDGYAYVKYEGDWKLVNRNFDFINARGYAVDSATETPFCTAEHFDGSLYFNNKEILYTLPVVSIREHVYIPLRETAEKLGLGVDWYENEHDIVITEPRELFKKVFGFDLPYTAEIVNYQYYKVLPYYDDSDESDITVLTNCHFYIKISLSEETLNELYDAITTHWFPCTIDSEILEMGVPNFELVCERLPWWHLHRGKDALRIYYDMRAGTYGRTASAYGAIVKESEDSDIYTVYFAGGDFARCEE